MSYEYLARVIVLVGALALAPVAQGDEPGATHTQATRNEIDEVTVTGSRRAQEVQNEAAAITAFSMDHLDRANIVEVDQLAFNVPALHVGQLGNQAIITLRGIGTENAGVAGEPGVAFHIDGVNLARPAWASLPFFDLESLQVLRGPQGSQGGKNATAGWVSLVTRKPTREFTTDVDVQWGSYNQRRLRASVNLPLNEYAQTRVAMFREDRNGFQRNVFLRDADRDAFDRDDFGWRAHLLLHPAENLEALFTYNFFEQNGNGPQHEIVGLNADRRCNPFLPPLGLGFNPLTHMPSAPGCGADPARGFFAPTGFDLEQTPVTRPLENPQTVDTPRSLATRASRTPHQLFVDAPPRQDNRFWGWTSALTWDVPTLLTLGDTTLKLVTSVNRAELDSTIDEDATDISFATNSILQTSDQWSSELRWFGGQEALDWKLSLFWMRETSDSRSSLLARTLGLQEVYSDQSTENNSLGLSLSTTLDLRDDLSLTLGARHTVDQRETRLLQDGSIFGALFGRNLFVCTGYTVDEMGFEFRPGFETSDGLPDDGTPDCEDRFRQTTGDATLEWWATEQNLLYGSVRNGFKAGGFNSDAPGGHEPEHLWAFSLGSKNAFFDERLVLNAEAFFYNYRNMQLVLISGFARRTDNADAEVSGVDLEFEAEPVAGLRINGSASWTETELTAYWAIDPIDSQLDSTCLRFGFCAPSDYSGRELARAPELTLMLGVEYELNLGRLGTLIPRAQYYWQDETWYRAFNRTEENSGRNAPCSPASRNIRLYCRSDGTLWSSADGRDLQDAYGLTDLKLSWRSPGERWSAEAFVTNLQDKVVYQNLLVGQPILDSPQLAWYGAPRLYGFRVGFRY